MPRDGLSGMGVPTKLGRCVIAWKGVTVFPEGLCSREGDANEAWKVCDYTEWGYHIS